MRIVILMAVGVAVFLPSPVGAVVGDLNLDGVVDLKDFFLLVDNFGERGGERCEFSFEPDHVEVEVDSSARRASRRDMPGGDVTAVRVAALQPSDTLRVIVRAALGNGRYTFTEVTGVSARTPEPIARPDSATIANARREVRRLSDLALTRELPVDWRRRRPGPEQL